MIKPKEYTFILTAKEAELLALVLTFCVNEIPSEFAAEREAAEELETVFRMKWGKLREP